MNPILDELARLSPEAQQALKMAGHSAVTDAAATPAPAPLTAPKAPMPTIGGNPSPLTPQHMPTSGNPWESPANIHPKQDAVPELAAPHVSSTMAPPPLAPPPASIPKPAGGTLEANLAARDRLVKTGSGIDQIHNPFLHGLARAGNVIGTIASGTGLIPGLMPSIPGTEEHHQKLIRDEDRIINQQQGERKSQAQTEEATARTGAETAAAEHARAEAAAIGQPKAKEEQWEVLPEYQGPNGEPVEHEKNSGQIRVVGGDVVPGLKRVDKQAKPDTPEQQFIDEFQKKHPNGTVGDAVHAYAAATQKPPVVNVNAGSARADKSYQYSNTVLDKQGEPISQAIQRLGRLRDTIAQGTPQADALVAPELLTVMAGGAGSGLRMNEAEISRVIGGRSKWENLKASVQAWSTDPSKANSITPDQRKQIHELVEHVNQKLLAKQNVLDEARNKLLDSDDPKEHRKIVNEARQKLTAIDEGKTEQQGSGAKAGGIEVVRDADGKIVGIK